MENPDAAEKPEASQGHATNLETEQPEEQPKVEGNQAAAEPENVSTLKSREDGKENASQSEEVIQMKKSVETLTAPELEAKKEEETQKVNEGDSGLQNTQLDGVEKTANEKSLEISDATKRVANIEPPEEQKEKVSVEGSIKHDVAVAEGPASEEKDNDVNEKIGTNAPKLEEKRNDVPSQNLEGQKGCHPEVHNSGREEDAMDIDTKPTKTESDQIALTGSKEEKEENIGPAGDSSIHDAMEIDSKPGEEDMNSLRTKQVEESTKHHIAEKTPNESTENDKQMPSESHASEQTPAHNSTPPQPAKQNALSSASADGTNPAGAASRTEKGREVADTPMEKKPIKEEESLPKDTEDKESTRGRPRRSSARNKYQPRTLRPRTSGRVNNAGNTSESPPVQESTPQKPRSAPDPSLQKPAAIRNPALEKQGVVDVENTPRPIMEAKGLVMRIDDAIFVTEDQLDEFKIARLTDKKVKPFELLTFQDLRTYNRDQLRAYCYAYGMARRKKTEMEADMARYLSYWNKGREGFALHEYVPTSSRVIDRVEPNPADSIGAIRAAATAHAGPASREGSATPTTSNGRASASAKPSSSRGATPSRSAGPAANSARVSVSQGSSALSNVSPAGAPTATGNSQAPGSIQIGAQRSSAAITRIAKPSATTPSLPRGFGTSFKQRVHARQAGAKFKAAYNGAGPAIVNIVENAAAYFEGKDSPEVILDQAKSYERYQFNVDMLNEIFDGVPDDLDEAGGDAEMTHTETDEGANDVPKNATPGKVSTGLFKKNVLEHIASRVASGTRKAQAAELHALEKQFKDMEERTKYTERTNMRLFQRLERAETMEQIESVKQEFETIHSIKFDDCNPRPLVRRKLDRSLPPLVMSDEKCRILRFKVS